MWTVAAFGLRVVNRAQKVVTGKGDRDEGRGGGGRAGGGAGPRGGFGGGRGRLFLITRKSEEYFCMDLAWILHGLVNVAVRPSLKN